jgi:hypothetical protein
MLLANSYSSPSCISDDFKKSVVLGYAEQFANNIGIDVVGEFMKPLYLRQQ